MTGDQPDDLARLLGPDRRYQWNWLTVTVVALFVITFVGMIALRPRPLPPIDRAGLGLTGEVVAAEVVAAEDVPCSFAADLDCHAVQFRVLEGEYLGEVAEQEFDIAPSSPHFTMGERVQLNVIPDAEPAFRFQFADRERRALLWGLAVLFGLAVVALGRLRGLAALASLIASIGVITAFIAPAILSGQSPLLVAVVGGSAIALLALYLAHGWRPLTHVAAIGTFSSLALTVILSALVLRIAQFSGFVSDETLFLTFVPNLDVRGLLLAGTVLGTLGALDDVTVTQASTIFELRLANPALTRIELFRSGIRVGRDHIASTVNTLLLAYIGASMPLVLLFSLSELPLGIVANSEVVAVEIVRTLVGSIGLVSAVPLTTWLSARMVTAPPAIRP